jgi:hypothetical protein
MGDRMTEWNTQFIEALDADAPGDSYYKPKRVPKPKKPTTHVLEDGQNILTVAELYLPWRMTRKEYAKDLALRNRNWSTGALIRL